VTHEYIRFVPEIGLWSFSRGRSTCAFRTTWCETHCYAQKFYRLGWARDDWDALDNEWWLTSTPESFVAELRRRARGTPSRFRFSVKGEIWTSARDVRYVREIARLLPDTLLWIPTRAWRDDDMLRLVWDVGQMTNVRVMCSVDPTVELEEVLRLHTLGMSVVFAGDNDPDQMRLDFDGRAADYLTSSMHRCRKTWSRLKGYCARCSDGCFSRNKVDVLLREHQ
jgi:hypothetical protein